MFIDDEEREFKGGKWRRVFCHINEALCTIITDKYVVGAGVGERGTRMLIYDRKNKSLIKKLTGFKWVYTGDVNPDETELFALEQGKHFFVISLPECEIKHKITLPRGYGACDVYGSYSDDGKKLFVPVEKDGSFRYFVCEYETENYSFIEMNEIDQNTYFENWQW